MSVFKKGSLATCAVLVGLIACTGVASATAVLKTSSGGTAYTGPVQARSTGNITFGFIPGTITCAHSYGLIANGSITNANITSTLGVNGTVAANSTFFGNNLATTATLSKGCSTSFGLPSCTARQSAAQSSPGVGSYTVSASQASTGGTVTVQLSKFSVVVDCKASDGSDILGCTYITGTSTSGGPITGSAPYVSGKASTISFANQPFVRTAGPGSCPGATAASPGKFSGSIALYTGSSGTAAQISAY